MQQAAWQTEASRPSLEAGQACGAVGRADAEHHASGARGEGHAGGAAAAEKEACDCADDTCNATDALCATNMRARLHGISKQTHRSGGVTQFVAAGGGCGPALRAARCAAIHSASKRFSSTSASAT